MLFHINCNMWNLDQKPLDQLAFAVWSENIVFHKDDVLSGENMVFINTKLNFYFDGLGKYISQYLSIACRSKTEISTQLPWTTSLIQTNHAASMWRSCIYTCRTPFSQQHAIMFHFYSLSLYTWEQIQNCQPVNCAQRESLESKSRGLGLVCASAVQSASVIQGRCKSERMWQCGPRPKEGNVETNPLNRLL